MTPVIEARGLVKSYEQKKIVDGIDLVVQPGECFGILGPNGAGKTSTLKMIYGSSTITGGDLHVLGLNAKDNMQKIKSLIGVIPQADGLDLDFSTLDNLIVYGRYFGLSAAKAKTKAVGLLRKMQLEDYADRSVETLSGGMQRRLTIARALLSDPQLLILDEPTVGLDPQARHWIWESLAQLKTQGKTLVLTTHYMEEAEQVCDRIVIMDQGKILCEGAPKDLVTRLVGHEVVEFTLAPADIEYYVKKVKDKYAYQVLNHRIRLFINEQQEGREAVSLIASSNITIRKASLNDVFLKLSGYELRDS